MVPSNLYNIQKHKAVIQQSGVGTRSTFSYIHSTVPAHFHDICRLIILSTAVQSAEFIQTRKEGKCRNPYTLSQNLHTDDSGHGY